MTQKEKKLSEIISLSKLLHYHFTCSQFPATRTRRWMMPDGLHERNFLLSLHSVGLAKKKKKTISPDCSSLSVRCEFPFKTIIACLSVNSERSNDKVKSNKIWIRNVALLSERNKSGFGCDSFSFRFFFSFAIRVRYDDVMGISSFRSARFSYL